MRRKRRRYKIDTVTYVVLSPHIPNSPTQQLQVTAEPLNVKPSTQRLPEPTSAPWQWPQPPLATGASQRVFFSGLMARRTTASLPSSRSAGPIFTATSPSTPITSATIRLSAVTNLERRPSPPESVERIDCRKLRPLEERLG